MFSRLSPSFARKGHKQITESEADEKDRIVAGVQFVVRYIGSTEVACANGTGSGKTEKPVAQVFEHQKRNGNGKTPRQMILTLCSSNVSLSDEACGKLVASFPICKITFCNIDNFHDKAFVFVARDKPGNPFKAFVFTCESKGKAREAFKALSLAFIINYESYQASLSRGTAKGNVSPDLYDHDTFFTSTTDASYKMDPPDQDSKKSEQTTSCDDVTSCPPQIILNAIYPGQERLSTPPPTPPVQNKSLLQVVDYRRHIRSSSDPTQIGVKRTGRAPSPLVVDNTTPNETKTEMEDTEFTEFAKLRSKCRSSSAGVNDYSDSILDQYSDCPNIWGDFQKSCPQIY